MKMRSQSKRFQWWDVFAASDSMPGNSCKSGRDEDYKDEKSEFKHRLYF